ncbi:Uracil phosphoribosyltransferase, synthesizes UMP from uracil [Bulinus truncatus]|nr:Uracil phosphoribosyltransferase, synthesizes UMP from uracil [Bulinus truncatus]
MLLMDQRASAELNDRNDPFDDPMPDKSSTDNSHGTRCAGEVAATANNNVCGVGVAYEASIGGIRLLDGIVTDGLEAEALTFNNDYIDIYSSSWGPSDDGIVMAGPGHLTSQAFKYGVQHGRRGLGSIFVWATGNGGMNSDNCNADGYVSRPETLAVGAVSANGKRPFYSENCTSILVVVPSTVDDTDGGQTRSKVITTDINGGCVETFQGTSSAAPLAAGCIAGVLQSNPSLTWRDIQHITVQAARIPSADHSWTINGAGHHVSHQFGFGLMDCGKMVHLAQSWKNVPEQKFCQFLTPKIINRKIPMSGSLQDTVSMKGCQTDQLNTIDRLEHVQVTVNMFTQFRGELSITLISPALTRSQLMAPRPNDSFSGDWTFTFMTVHNWGESPVGNWTLQIQSTGRRDVLLEEASHSELTTTEIVSEIFNNKKVQESESVVHTWNLILWGTSSGYQSSAALEKITAFQPTSQNIEVIMNEEIYQSKHILNKEKDQDVVVKPPTAKLAVERSNSVNGGVIENTDTENIQKRMLNIKNYHLENELEEIEKLTEDITEKLEELLNDDRHNFYTQ